MCKINLKKLDSKQNSQEQKAPINLNAVNIDLGELEMLLEGKQNLFDEPFMTLNGTPLFTPVALNLEAEGYPFPVDQNNNNNNANPNMNNMSQSSLSTSPLLSSPSSSVATSPAINAAPYAALMNPAIPNDSEEEEEEEEDHDDAFEFKYIPEQYEETADRLEESEYSLSSGSSAPTSPISGSSDSEHKSFNRQSVCRINSSPASSPYSALTSPSSIAPFGVSFNASLPAPNATCSSRQSKRKLLHNPQISDEKRERNRLAAEKYRKKGRDLVVTLERKCEELARDNANLFQKNKCLEDELARLREILMKSGHQ